VKIPDLHRSQPKVIKSSKQIGSLLIMGAVVFTLLLIGLAFTVIEFRNLK